MREFQIKHDDGIAIMMEHPHPGSGGRHRETRTYGCKPNLSSQPREELATDILDVRSIYMKDDVYTEEIKEGLIEVIRRNKTQYPEVFKKGK